jgi:hypothetical protein
VSDPRFDDDDGPDEPIDPARFHQPVKDLPGLAGFVALGSTLAVLVSLGVLGGLWLDSAAGISPWGLLVGLLLGAAVGVLSVVKLVRRWL